MSQKSKLKYLKAKEKYLSLKNQIGNGEKPILALQSKEIRDKRVARQTFERNRKQNMKQKERKAILKEQQLYQARERMKKEEKEREQFLLQYKQDLEQTPILKLNYDTIENILKNLTAVDILNFYFSFDITKKDYKVLIQKYVLDFIKNYFKLPNININALDEYLRMVYSFYNGNKNYLNELESNYYDNRIRLNELKDIVQNQEYFSKRNFKNIIFNYFNHPEDQLLRDKLLRNELINTLYDEIKKIINDLKDIILDEERAEEEALVSFYEEMADYEDYHERSHFNSRGYGWFTEEEIRRERGPRRGGPRRRRSSSDDFDY
jgi:hypothetical protein